MNASSRQPRKKRAHVSNLRNCLHRSVYSHVPQETAREIAAERASGLMDGRVAWLAL